jgi:hypothetical protein
VISFDVDQHQVERFARLASNQFGDALPCPYDFLSLNSDITGSSADSAARLMNQEARIPQTEKPLARGSQIDGFGRLCIQRNQPAGGLGRRRIRNRSEQQDGSRLECFFLEEFASRIDRACGCRGFHALSSLFSYND